MKSYIACLALVAVIALTVPTVALAQRGRGSVSSRIYDPQTVETVSGRVISIEQVARGAGSNYGIHLELQTDHGTLSVHLGPQEYLRRHGVTIAPHDSIKVTGSRVTLRGEPVLIAAQIRKGNRTVLLRNALGVPLWSGPARR